MSTPPPADPDAFRSFEHAGWQGIPAQYDKAFSQLTTQAIGPLLDAAGVTSGAHVLDVATGPGYVAAAAAQRGASVVGVDFSAAMVAEARRRYPTIDFREGDAAALPFPDETFDAVVMNFGLLHLAQPEQAIGEAQRILRSGGKLSYTVWAGPDEAVGLGIVLGALRDHGNLNVPLPPGPPFFRFSDPAESQRVLSAAGFAAPAIVKVPQVWRLDSPEALFEAMYAGTVRTGGLLRAQTPEALRAIRAAIVEAASAYQRGEALELPMPAVLASAVNV